MPAAYSSTYNGWPGDRAVVTCRSQDRAPSPLPAQLASVDGNSRMLDAKIAGITPAMFSFSGRWLVCAAYMRCPC